MDTSSPLLLSRPSPLLRIESLRCHLLAVPVAEPVRNSFRVLTERNTLLIELRDADGVTGWGEVWCNYPPGGARHRATLLREVVSPLVEGRHFADPNQAFVMLQQALRIPVLQCGEPGPFAQVAAGVDVALWDLAARKLGLPLWRWLGGVDEVAVYASGIGPQQPLRLAEHALAEGYTAVKLKVGFGDDADLGNLRALRALLGRGEIMVDANQRWTAEQALDAARVLATERPLWLEEPIAADEPPQVWRDLARQSPVPLAAGENLRGEAAFAAMLEAKILRAVQPDIGKWGGFSGCLALARRASAAGVLFCPHWLGGGIGLAASLHLLAAAGGDGWGEIDINRNALREEFLFEGFAVRGGRLRLSDAPGLGVTPEEELLARFRA